MSEAIRPQFGASLRGEFDWITVSTVSFCISLGICASKPEGPSIDRAWKAITTCSQATYGMTSSGIAPEAAVVEAISVKATHVSERRYACDGSNKKCLEST